MSNREDRPRRTPNTHGYLQFISDNLKVSAEHVLDQITDDTSPLWRNQLEKLHAQIMIAVVSVDSVVGLLPPALGGASPDPWDVPPGVSSGEVLDVLTWAQRHGLNVRTHGFNDLRAAKEAAAPALSPDQIRRRREMAGVKW